MTYHNIATVLDLQRNYQEALRFYEKALEIGLCAFIPNNLCIAETYSDMGLVLDSLDKKENALACFHQALDRCPESSASARQLRATVLNNIVEIYKDQNDFTKAVHYHSVALNMRLHIFANIQHPDLAMSYKNIGVLLYYQFQFAKACRYLFKGSKIYRAILPVNHPKPANILRNLGNAYYTTGEFKRALALYEQALNIQRNHHPEQNRRAAELYAEIVQVKHQITVINQRWRKRIMKKYIRRRALVMAVYAIRSVYLG
jgi:tetratricopeptide (TPR) repeat protein